MINYLRFLALEKSLLSLQRFCVIGEFAHLLSELHFLGIMFTGSRVLPSLTIFWSRSGKEGGWFWKKCQLLNRVMELIENIRALNISNRMTLRAL